MSKSIKKLIEARIKDASQESPIAVFKTDETSLSGERLFNAVFASTIVSSEILRKGDDNLLGVFYGATGVCAFSSSC